MYIYIYIYTYIYIYIYIYIYMYIHLFLLSYYIFTTTVFFHSAMWLRDGVSESLKFFSDSPFDFQEIIGSVVPKIYIYIYIYKLVETLNNISIINIKKKLLPNKKKHIHLLNLILISLLILLKLLLLDHLLNLCRRLCGHLGSFHSVCTCFVLSEINTLLFLSFSSKLSFVKAAISGLAIKFVSFTF